MEKLSLNQTKRLPFENTTTFPCQPKRLTPGRIAIIPLLEGMKVLDFIKTFAKNWYEISWNSFRKNKKVPAGPPPDAANVSYGPHRRQTFDFWHPLKPAKSPVPLLIFFHGGGFIRGKKYHSRILREARKMGAAAVSVNYRLAIFPGLNVGDSMEDGASAIRAVIQRAKEWNIDQNRIALAGNSAGGCLALWSAFTENPCPVRCVLAHNSLTTFDPETQVRDLGGPSLSNYWLLWLFLFESIGPGALKRPRMRRIVETYSPLARFHPKVPPAYLSYTENPPETAKYPTSTGIIEILHSSLYGRIAKESYDRINTECFWSYPARPANITQVEFLKRHLFS